MARDGGRLARMLLATALVGAGTVIVLPADGVVSAEGYVEWPEDEDRVLYMAPTPNNLPGSGLLPYVIPVPEGELFFNGSADPITGFDRLIEVDTTENAATCNANRALTPPSYGGCSFVKLNVSHGDLKVGGALAATDPSHTVVQGAFAQTTINNPDGSFELYIRGLEAEINAALTTLSYVPADGHYHTGESGDLERLDVLLSSAQGSIVGNSSRIIYIRVLDVNDWPTVTAPPDTTVNAAEAVAFTAPPVVPEEGVKYTNTRFHATDEDNDDGTDEDNDGKRDGPLDDMLVAMWTTCGSFEITDKNTFSFIGHVEEVIDTHFKALYGESILDDPLVSPAIEAAAAAINDALGDAGFDEALLASEVYWSGGRVAAFVGLADNMPGVLDAFDEVTFFAREPGQSTTGAYLDDMNCELYAFVSDLGNNGLPLQFFEYYTGGYDIVAPWLGFDWDSVMIGIGKAREIDISFDTSDPLYVNEGEEGVARLVVSPADHPGFEIDWAISPRVGDPVVVGQATANSDFQGTFGNSLVVPAGVTEIPLPPPDELSVVAPNIDTYADGVDEGILESFTFELDTVTEPAPPGWKFAPTTPTRPGFIVDLDDAGATVSTFADQTSPEGDVGDTPFLMTFEIVLDKPADGGETVDVVLTDGSATNPDDYGDPVPATVEFAPGASSATFDVPIVPDDLDEGDHSFTVTLENPGGGLMLPADASATGTIIDDDGPIGVSILDDVTIAEGHAGTTNATFTLTLAAEAEAEGDETVDVLLTPGSATNPDDYGGPVSSTVTFAPGATTATFTVPIVGDTIPEPDETFTVELENPSGLTITGGTATGTITNDDLAFAVPPTATVAEGATGTFSVAITPAVHPGFNLAVALGSSTATAGTDFDDDEWPYTLVVLANETSIDVPINALADLVADDGETYAIEISPGDLPPGFGITPSSAATTTVTITDVAPADSEISIEDLTVSEAVGTASLTVTNSFPARTCAVTVTTTDVTADAPDDYAAISGALFDVDGVDTVDVTIVDDIDVEDLETFTVTLALTDPPGPGCVIVEGEATVTIESDDQYADISILNAEVTEEPGDDDEVEISMTNWVPGLTCGLLVSSTDGSATQPTDYAQVGPDQPYDLASSSAMFSLTIVDDSDDDDDETFTISIELQPTADPRCRIDDGADVATVTIIDNDDDETAPAVTINQAPGQPDPTSVTPIMFRVVFTEPVTGFETGDVTLSGTGNPTTAVVTNTGDDRTFDVAVSGMTSGTVIATVGAGVATDAASNPNAPSTSTDNTVTYDAPVVTPLGFTVPPDITVPNDPGQAGAVVTFAAPTASGGVPPIDIACNRQSGEFYPLGTTTVSCTATDSEIVQLGGQFVEAIVSGSFTITVVDVEPPVIGDGPDLERQATTPNGAVVTYDTPPATDNAGPPTVVCAPASGLTYPIGVTTVTCTATDAAGNSASSSFTITVAPPDSGPTVPTTLPPSPTTTLRPSGTLPATGGGSSTRGVAAVALVLIAVGWIAVARSRSRSVNGV